MVTMQIRVIYGDTDQMGVVYYANYLRYFEAARSEFIRAKGLRYRDLESVYRMMLPVTEAAIQYRQPARYDDLLSVEITLSEARRASARFEYRILRGEQLLVSGHTVHACVSVDGKVQRLPKDVLTRLSAGEPASAWAGERPNGS